MTFEEWERKNRNRAKLKEYIWTVELQIARFYQKGLIKFG